MSSYPGHHPSSKEMQFLQQHMMLKKLQELQRQQQQLQQQDLGARQQNLLSQDAIRRAVTNQLPSLQHGMPINVPSGYMLPNNIMGGELNTLNNSQMFTYNNMNWAQGRGSSGAHGSSGVTLANDHGQQTLSPVGFVPQQLDQSFYGTPVSSSRGLLNQYAQLQGMPNNYTDMMSKVAGNQFEQASVHLAQPNSFQKDQRVPEQACYPEAVSAAGTHSFQGKSIFDNTPFQTLSSDVTPENFQQVMHPQHNPRVQTFQEEKEQADWSSNLEEKAATQAGSSRGVTSLDPTEEKILFGTDGDSNLGALFGGINNMGSGGYLHGDLLEGNDGFGAFPSLQSGSWSALMQEAVQSSSSDKGSQEEWSGLSFQKKEPSGGVSPSIINYPAKQQAAWEKKSTNLNAASSESLRPFPLFNDANSGPPLPSTSGFLHSTGSAYEENNGAIASHDSFQHPSKEQNMHFERGDKIKEFHDSGHQVQIQSNDVPHGDWSQHMYEQPIKSSDSANKEFNQQKNQGTWRNQPLFNINKQLDSNPTLSGNAWDGLDNRRTWYVQNCGNSSGGTEPVKSDIGVSQTRSLPFSTPKFSGTVNSNNLNTNQELNQHALNRYQVHTGKHAFINSSEKSRGETLEENDSPPSKRQVQESSVMSDSQGMAGWKSAGPDRFQSHLKEELRMSVEPAEPPKDIGYPQGLLGGKLGASSSIAFRSDAKMLSFSSRENEESDTERTAKLVGQEALSQDVCLSGHLDLHSQTQPLTSTSHFIGRNEHLLLNSQMAQSWSEQYKKYKNGQILAMYAHQKSAKVAPQQYLPSEVPERIDDTMAEQRIETGQFGYVSQSTSSSSGVAIEASHKLSSAITDHDMIIRSKKRKTATSELLPWHKVVSLVGQRPKSTSMAERDWAHVTNRLTEKVEDVVEMLEDDSFLPRARKRLILSTQLMQQLLPTISAPLFNAKVTSTHESMMYFLAKSSLGDACSLIACSGNSAENLDNGNRTYEKCKTSEKDSEVFFSKVVEDFVGRSRKLETAFSRLDKRTSVLDVRLEFQEVEKFSIVNRLATLHGRSQAEGAESSNSGPRKIFPARYITAFSMPGHVPEGVQCLSL